MNNDYQALIEKLRNYSEARRGEIAELTEQAADAIEHLVNRLDDPWKDSEK